MDAIQVQVATLRSSGVLGTVPGTVAGVRADIVVSYGVEGVGALGHVGEPGQVG